MIADVTSADDRQKMVDAAWQKLGGLTCWLEQRRHRCHRPLRRVDRRADAQDLRGQLLRHHRDDLRLPAVARQVGKTPAILNISSIAARRGIPARSDYSASKFAVQGWSEAIRAELDKDGIDVIVVNPGLTQTNFSKNMLEQKAKMQMDHMAA
ncbi:MAG: SDR family NAD(P)-dependent oxidoreductase [Gemmataceae bacterium]